tara:strand:+ start:14142 stop:15167 length:1026 start_codon:yes stop_codon:yes gene_type:complete
MNPSEFLRNLIIHTSGGIFNKFNNSPSKNIRINTCQEKSTYLPQNLLKTINVDKYPKYTGTVGIIFLGIYQNQTVSIKIISNITKKNVSNDLNVIRYFGSIISNFLPHINGMTNEICNKLSHEISIEREKKMCNLIQQKLSNNCPKGVEFIQPIPEFTHIKNVFVYNHVHGISLRNIIKTTKKTIIDSIGFRIALCFFNAIYQHKILFGDMNIDNFIYNVEKDIITFIDYGCVFELDNNQRQQIISLHKAQKSKHTLRSYLKHWNAPNTLADIIYEKSRIFYDKNHTTKKTQFADILQYTHFANTKLPPQLILTIRATCQLIDLQNYLGSSCVIYEHLNLL